MNDKVKTMPAVHTRRPVRDDLPHGALEGFLAYANNNRDGVEWFLDRAEAIRDAISTGQKALVGDSNDDEHDALVELVQALSMGLAPECECSFDRESDALHHEDDCPARTWEVTS